jgi:hypothetical protein
MEGVLFAILGLEKVDDSTEETLENIKDEMTVPVL